MDIRIYQIDSDYDEKRIKFVGLDSLEKYQGSAEINSNIYKQVFDGAVDCKSLEDVFRVFNLSHPIEFWGHSLSVSDVVEVAGEAGNIAPGFYFCDSWGFTQVEFHPDQILPPGQLAQAVYLEPGKEARTIQFPVSLASMQRLVQGKIERTFPFTERDVCIYLNMEGKNDRLPLNRAIHGKERITEISYTELTALFREAEQASGDHVTGYVVISVDSFEEEYSEEARTYVISSDNKAFCPNMGGYSIYASSLDGSDRMVRLERYLAAEKGGANGWKIEKCYIKEPGKVLDIIAGPCFICGSEEGKESLSDAQTEHYLEQFRWPEKFYDRDGEIIAVPYKPKQKLKTNER